MKKSKLKLVASAMALWGLFGCMEKDVYNAERVEQEIAASFDYKLTVECQVTLQYERKALVEIYDANPLRDAGAKRLYVAFTDDKGCHKGTMVIPKEYIGKKVYARSNSIGTSYLLSGTVAESGLDIMCGNTRGVVSMEKSDVSEAMVSAIEKELPEGKNNSAKLGETNDINLKVSKDCTIDVTFVWGGLRDCDWWTGHWEPCIRDGEDWVNNDFACNLYYFVYSENDIPTKEEIQQNFINDDYLVVGKANQNSSNDLKGTTVRLTLNGDETVKAGTRIGWVITHPNYEYRNQWNPAEQAERIPYVYSIPQYNEGGKSRSIRYQYGEGDEKVILYGMEDLPEGGIKVWGENWDEHNAEHVVKNTPTDEPFFRLNSDEDYNDILFTIHASPMDAIIEEDIPVLPDEPATPEYASESDEGTLLFEDLYPLLGDYDMNDVVLRYKLTKHFDDDNKLVKLGYEFTPVWDGASYDSSFGFMFDGLIDTPVSVFESHKEVLNKTFEGEVADNLAGMDKDALSWDAFNPFIRVKDTDREVHLTRKRFSPSANLEGLDEYQKNYVNKSGYPFAMKIPVLDFSVVTETVRIDVEYPDYVKWVESDGEQGLDWYKTKENN